MELVWRERAAGRWVGKDEGGQVVGFVSYVVWDGGKSSTWTAWFNDFTLEGIHLGDFETAEAAMVATDEA